MKNISVLITLAVLLVSMVGTAGATVQMTEFEDGCYCVHLEGEYSPDLSNIPVPTGADLSINNGLVIPQPPYTVEVDAQVCKSGDDITVTVLESNPGVTINSLDFPMLYQEQIQVVASGTCAMGHLFSGNMMLVGGSGTYQSTVATGLLDNTVPMNGAFTVTIKECDQEIPEFPTIAVPVLAIMGLAFIMQRRKD